MPVTTIPTKTPLGHEEMRRRTGGLGQRHRTILFLIDGRRPLASVWRWSTTDRKPLTPEDVTRLEPTP